MPTDKQLLIDLTALTPESVSQLATIQDDIVEELEKSGKRTKKQIQTQIKKEKSIKEKQKKQQKSKKQVKKLSNKEIASELPINEIASELSGNLLAQQLKSTLIKFGPLLLVAGVFVEQLLKLDRLNKKFIDIANKRISVFIERQQEALIETFQNQVIYTTKAGVTSARDVYNSFNLADTVNKNNGIERDLTSFGGID